MKCTGVAAAGLKMGLSQSPLQGLPHSDMRSRVKFP